MNSNTAADDTRKQGGRSLLAYFLLVFLLSVPFWVLGAIATGPLSAATPANLPLSALAVFNPLIAALIVSYREGGSREVKALLGKILDYRKAANKAWIVGAALLMPAVMVLSYVVMRLAGSPLPDPRFPLATVPVLAFAYFVAAIGQELGWQGYAFDPMQARWGALNAGILLGVVWAVWHIVGYVQGQNSPGFVVWQCVASVSKRVLIVWLYNNTGRSVFSAILFHTVDSLSWTLFPNRGSHYNPFLAAAILSLAAAAATFLWGRKTLSRFRFA